MKLVTLFLAILYMALGSMTSYAYESTNRWVSFYKAYTTNDGTWYWPNIPGVYGTQAYEQKHKVWDSDDDEWDNRYYNYVSTDNFWIAQSTGVTRDASGNIVITIDDLQLRAPEFHSHGYWNNPSYTFNFPGAIKVERRFNSWDEWGNHSKFDGTWSTFTANKNGDYTYTKGVFDYPGSECRLRNGFAGRLSIRITYPAGITDIPKVGITTDYTMDAGEGSWNFSAGRRYHHDAKAIIYILADKSPISVIVGENAIRSVMHTHNKNKKTYTQIAGNASQHTVHYYCDADNQDMGSANENHSYGAWSAWSNISGSQQRRERKCSSCGYIEYGYQARPYYLDLNGTLDNVNQANIANYGHADIYINGSLVSKNVEDYYTTHPYGAVYKVVITAASGKQVFGKSVFEGTIGAGNVDIRPDIRTIYTIGYDLRGGRASGNPETYNIGSNTFTLKNPTRTGYHFTGWTGSNGSTPQTAVTINKGSAGNRSYRANWTPVVYEITYKLFGGAANNPATYTIETAAFNLKAPTPPAGYTFTGWTGSSGSTPDTTVTVHKGTYGSLHFNAVYKPVTTDKNSQTEEKENQFDYQQK